MAFERGEIRTRRLGGRHGWRGRRRATRRDLARRRRIKFALARSDFRDREVERRRAERRRGAIDLGRGALDHVGLALPVLKLGLFRRLRVRDLRQPRVEARNGVVQLPGDALLGAGRLAARVSLAARINITAWLGLGNLLDLAGDRIQPLMDIGDVAGFLARRHRSLIGRLAKIGWGRFADGGIEPVAQRHAGTPRGGLGPLADGWIDALNTPRYARIHAFVRFRLQRSTCAFSLPARPWRRDNRIPRRSSASGIDFFVSR